MSLARLPLIALLLALLLSCPGCAGTPRRTSEPPAERVSVYRSGTGLTFSYPRGWRLVRNRGYLELDAAQFHSDVGSATMSFAVNGTTESGDWDDMAVIPGAASRTETATAKGFRAVMTEYELPWGRLMFAAAGRQGRMLYSLQVVGPQDEEALLRDTLALAVSTFDTGRVAQP